MENYDSEQKIGEGAFGQCFLAKKDGLKFVIKKIELPRDGDEMTKKAALTEVALLKALKHPNIVIYQEAFLSECKLCIVMEYCEKGDLYNKIHHSEDIPFPEETIMCWIVQVCMALHFIHKNNILHRDIKPQNIFLAQGGRVKLGDFGLAKVLESPGTFATTLCGTALYVAPEVFMMCQYNHKSDIWSLGCVFYELCTKKFYKIESVTRKDPFVLCLPYDKGVIAAMRRMLEIDPSLRLSTHEILKDIPFQNYIKQYYEMTPPP